MPRPLGHPSNGRSQGGFDRPRLIPEFPLRFFNRQRVRPHGDTHALNRRNRRTVRHMIGDELGCRCRDDCERTRQAQARMPASSDRRQAVSVDRLAAITGRRHPRPTCGYARTQKIVFIADHVTHRAPGGSPCGRTRCRLKNRSGNSGYQPRPMNPPCERALFQYSSGTAGDLMTRRARYPSSTSLPASQPSPPICHATRPERSGSGVVAGTGGSSRRRKSGGGSERHSPRPWRGTSPGWGPVKTETEPEPVARIDRGRALVLHHVAREQVAAIGGGVQDHVLRRPSMPPSSTAFRDL